MSEWVGALCEGAVVVRVVVAERGLERSADGWARLGGDGQGHDTGVRRAPLNLLLQLRKQRPDSVRSSSSGRGLWRERKGDAACGDVK